MFGAKLDIFKKEWIDVVFTGRNKAYGAYELRTTSPRTTSRALIFGVAAFAFILSINTIANYISGFIPKAPEKVDIHVVKLLPPPPVDPAKKPPPPPPEPPKPRVTQVKFPPPVVKPDDQAKEPPPTTKELEKADPGQNNQKGDPNADINIDGPVGNSDTKVTESDPNQVFTAVEIEPSFKGPGASFSDFLQKNIKYPAVDRENNVQGRVFINFVVETNGSVSNIKATRGPSETTEDEAIRVIKLTKWNPGIQNGRPVRTNYTVPVNFALAEE